MKEKLLEKLESLDADIARIRGNKEEVKAEILEYAKYKKGDIVLTAYYTKEKIKGIIIKAIVDKGYSDDYAIRYRIAKAKKDGTAHATATIGWGEGIAE